MASTPLLFRYRVPVLVALLALGLVAPWDYWLHLDGSGPNAHVWGRLAVALSKGGALGISAAFDLVLAVGTACALFAAWLRTWASAYLGGAIMQDSRLHGATLTEDGPYRFVRNPLYLGLWAHALALAMLMPPSGAIFALVGVSAVQVRLILEEEAFLRARLGAPYAAYCERVPRLLPALRPRVAASGARPGWRQAVLAEISMWGVALSFAVAGRQYNAGLLIRCVLVSFGVSLVVRAFAPARRVAEGSSA